MSRNWVEVQHRTIRWNGTPITPGELSTYVSLVEQMNPRPQLMLDVDHAVDCAFATKVRNIIAAKLSCGDVDCWQGGRDAYLRSKFNPDKPVPPPW